MEGKMKAILIVSIILILLVSSVVAAGPVMQMLKPKIRNYLGDILEDTINDVVDDISEDITKEIQNSISDIEEKFYRDIYGSNMTSLELYWKYEDLKEEYDISLLTDLDDETLEEALSGVLSDNYNITACIDFIREFEDYSK